MVPGIPASRTGPPPQPARRPDPALVVLVGAAGSGKSHWAREHYRAQEVVSSDALRGMVGSGPHDLEASDTAFAVLDQVVAARVRRHLTAVVDTLGLEQERRQGYLALARAAGLPAVAVVLDTPPALCRERNRSRDRPVPAPALSAQLRRMAQLADRLQEEGWDVVETVTAGRPGAAATDEAVRTPARGSDGPELVLQLSRFPWGEDPARWLRETVLAADEIGFDGVALMDHLIQIPQVDRAWEPIPEPFVTLGLLAGLDTRLRLGTLCTPATFRAPGIIAKAVATLDALSGGRAFCGIGAGWWEREHAAYGLAFPGPRERLDALATAVETLRALWAPGTRAYDGRGVSLPETTCYPRPAGKIPIVVGGSGELRTLRIAARWGDACNLSSDPTALARGMAALSRHCAEVGRDPDEVAVTVLDLPVAGHDRDDAWARVERWRGRTDAATYARRHHAAPAADHRRRYEELAALGVRTIFVAPVGLDGAEDLRRLAGLVAQR